MDLITIIFGIGTCIPRAINCPQNTAKIAVDVRLYDGGLHEWYLNLEHVSDPSVNTDRGYEEIFLEYRYTIKSL